MNLGGVPQQSSHVRTASSLLRGRALWGATPFFETEHRTCEWEVQCRSAASRNAIKTKWGLLQWKLTFLTIRPNHILKILNYVKLSSNVTQCIRYFHNLLFTLMSVLRKYCWPNTYDLEHDYTDYPIITHIAKVYRKLL